MHACRIAQLLPPCQQTQSRPRMRLCKALAVLALLACAPRGAAGGRKSKKSKLKESRAKGADVTSQFLEHIGRNQFDAALEVMGHGKVKPTTTGLCTLAHTWKANRCAIWMRAELGLRIAWPLLDTLLC
jgi:hypothetical protein